MKDSSRRFAIGAAVAATAGYLAGLLTAPQSGKETRQDIKDVTSRGMYEAERQLKQRFEHCHPSNRASIGKKMERARRAKETAREILSAVHEGRAEDKELEKAVKDAQKAVSHLKGYLKKRT